MKRPNYFSLLALFIATSVVFAGCSGCSKVDEDGERHEEGGGESEESSDMIGRFEELDMTRHDAHLMLRYNEEANTFFGTIMNMSTETLENVRIEVHLSNGREIGPTNPVNLVKGQSMDLTLQGPEEAFVEWTAHVEVGEGEH